MAHILLMEDEEDFARLLAKSLEEAGHVVTIRADATAAQQAFENHDIDLVIADVIVRKDGQSIPDGGLTLITKIRRMIGYGDPSLPIIAISGVTHYPGMHSVLSIASSLGASATLRKPFAPATMLATIDDLLAKAKQDEDET